ncbi:peptide deformylase [Cellulomonas fimi]|uniref:peptide deformylase n=1 Tax=Cellulomonas fimi TaxID=1708 RepID=UPI0027DF79FD|nr:peptide deformylase [Cellulomonas fimi]
MSTTDSARQRDVALRDLVLRLLDAAHGTGTVPIVQAGHPVLRAQALPYDGQLADDELESLVHVMRATMHAAPGVGLAAPQIGLPLAVAVIEDSGPPDGDVGQVRERSPLAFRVLVNPRYAPVDDERVAFYEGCLSVVGYQAVVARARHVHLVGADERGRPLDEVVSGWPARIVQHETDHLGGVLYLDRAELRSLAAADALGLRWASEPRPTTAARALGFDLGAVPEDGDPTDGGPLDGSRGDGGRGDGSRDDGSSDDDGPDDEGRRDGGERDGGGHHGDHVGAVRDRTDAHVGAHAAPSTPTDGAPEHPDAPSADGGLVASTDTPAADPDEVDADAAVDAPDGDPVGGPRAAS